MTPRPEPAVVVPERTLQALRVLKLTSRELEVLQLVADDLTDKQIAYRLDISASTVSKYLTHIHHKLKTRSRLGAVMAGIRAGKVTP